MRDFRQSVAGILSHPKSQFLGTGFFISGGCILTCAHVIEDYYQPGRVINFQVEGQEAVHTAEVIHFSPKEEQDIALLRPTTPVADYAALPLSESAGSRGHAFSIFGYPKMGGFTGLNGAGQIMGHVRDENGRDALQLDSRQITHGFSGAPVWDESTQAVVGMLSRGIGDEEIGRPSFAIPTETLRLVCPELQLSIVCPYRSLDAFREEDARYFFGRERLSARLLESLRREPRFLAVLGPSGSGKSSVVRAGLIPSLKLGKVLDSDKWGVIITRPAAQPFEELAEAGLANAANAQAGLENAARAWLAEHPDRTRLVLVIDQFEELMVSCSDEDRRTFIQELVHLLEAPAAITVVLTLRDDFYSRFLKDAHPLAPWLERGLVNIPLTLEEDELRAIVTEPARVAGLSFEDGLADSILVDAMEADRTVDTARSTILPLLEFCLAQLWEKRQDGRLMHDAYHAIGGVTGGLTQWADRVYYGLNSVEQRLTREIFGELIRPGNEKEQTPDTRRVVSLDALGIRAQRGALEPVINKLVKARLLATHRDIRTGRETVEIIHEALLREWGLLRTWMEEYRNREQRALERRRRWIMVGLSLGLAVMIALSLVAVRQTGIAQKQSRIAETQAQRAEEQAQIALARQLAAQAQSINATRSSKQMIAVLLAAKSMQMLPSAEAARMLQSNLLAGPIARMTHDRAVTSVAFSPDGKYVVSGSGDRTARAWEAATGVEIARMTHDSSVGSVAFSPDGNYVVSASDDHTARVWEAATGKEIARMTHDGTVSSVAFSPDGKYVASGGRDNTARVWEAATGNEIARMTHGDQDGSVSSVAFSPDGRYVASGSYDSTARVWEAGTGEEIARITHEGPVWSVAFSPDGKYVVSAGKDNTARVWEAATGEEIARMTHNNYVSSVAFSPDGRYVASGSEDRTARVWEAATGREITRMTHDGPVTSVAFSPDGKYVISGSGDGTARAWEAATGVEIARMTHDGIVNSVAFSPLDGGTYLVSGSADGTARAWEAATGAEIARMRHDDRVTSLAFSPPDGGKYIVSGSWDRTARVWEAATGEEIARMTHENYVSSVAFSPDGRYVVSGSGDKTARVWDAATGVEIARMTHDGLVLAVAFSPLDGGKYLVSADPTARAWEAATGVEIAHLTHVNYVKSVAFSPDGKYVVSAGDYTARAWEAATGVEIARMTHDSWVYSAGFSPDGKYIVSGSGDRTARVWEAATGVEIARMTHNSGVNCVAFSPDGKYVVSGGYDYSARVWEAATEEEIARMTHDGPVSSVAFSPDGKYVVSGGEDNTARVWEAASGNEIARMTHDGPVSSVAFSPDGKYVVSGSDDGTARVWIWQPDDLIAQACSRVDRNLTHAEWKQYIGDALPYQKICPNLPVEPTVLTDVAQQALSDTNDPNRVQTAIHSVSDLLKQDSNSDDPGDQAKEVVRSVIEEQISKPDLAAGKIEPYLGLLEDAEKIDLEIKDASKLNSVCWNGSLWGYAARVLIFCGQAVLLAPDDWDIRDSRGLARALTGDFSGAIADFEFAVTGFREHGRVNPALERETWIKALKAGQNPFDDQTLEALRNE